jgi:surface antigen
MRYLKLAAVLAGALALGACQTYGGQGYGPKTVGGAVIGGVAGGLLGSQFGSGSGQLIATGVGTLLGAAVGGSAGQSLDRADALYAERAYSDSIYSQGPVHWRNPQSGHHGQFQSGPAYSHGGRECKQIESTYYGPQGPYQDHATACRMPDGSWRTI